MQLITFLCHHFPLNVVKWKYFIFLLDLFATYYYNIKEVNLVFYQQ